MDELEISVKQIRKQVEFFSEVLEIPLLNFEHKTEISTKTNTWNSKTKIKLGDYSISLFYEPAEESGWTKKISEFSYKDLLIKDSVLSSGYIDDEFHISKTSLDNAVAKLILHDFGGIDTETPFMDYEQFSFESLFNSFDNEGSIIEKEKDNSYFKNIYLLLMTHQKELGKQMPPILGKNQTVSIEADFGRVENTLSLLKKELLYAEGNYRRGCIIHMKKESEAIIKKAKKREIHFDQSIPLSEKFSNLEFRVINGKNIGKYNILVVEDFGDQLTTFGSIGRFGKNISNELENDGNFLGTNIVSEFNLDLCRILCSTGQIDMMIMDGCNDNGLERFYLDETFREEKSADRKISLDIRVLDENTLKRDPNLNAKYLWANQIGKYCNYYGIEMPPCCIDEENVLNAKMLPTIKKVLSEKDLLKGKIIRYSER